MTNIPKPTLDATGFRAPTEAEVFTGVWADINAAFNNALSENLETPQGQIATSNSAAIHDAFNQFVALFNGIDPAFADGRMQDAICRLNFISRRPATSTTVVARCYGRTGATIPAGSLASTPSGETYATVANATIPAEGYVDVAFANIATGPVPCPAGSLNIIFAMLSGWDSVTNLVDGTPGTNAETRRELEERRRASVAANARSTVESIRGSVMGISEVLDAYVVDNPSSSAATIGGVSVAAYSVFASIRGGSDADVAKALWRKKPPGVPWASGNTTVTVSDTSEGYTAPYPFYDVSFTRPTTIPISFAVRIATNANVPTNAADLIRKAIVDAFNGLDGGERPTIGTTVFASRFISAIAAVGAWCHVLDCFIGSPAAGSTFVGTGAIVNNVLSVSAVTSGALAVGDFVTGVNAPTGARIVSLGTGTGGTGTYNLSTTISGASASIAAHKANLTNLGSTIAQIPAVTADSISVTVA